MAAASASASASGAAGFIEVASSSAHHTDVVDALRENRDFDFSNRRDELAKIQRGDNRTIEVLIRDRLPLGALVYKNALDDQYSKLGRCLALRAIVVFNEEVGETPVATRLVRRAIAIAKAKHAQGIYVKTLGDDSSYPIFRDCSFKTARAWSEQETIRLMHRSIDTESRNGAHHHSQSSSAGNRKRGANRNLRHQPEQKRARSQDVSGVQAQQGPTVHSIPLRNPYLGQIKTGSKTIEGRINSGMMLRLQEGDRVRFHNHTDAVTTEITRITRYDSFRDMLTAEGVQTCLPGVRSVQEGVGIYDRIPNYSQKAARFGVLGIELKLVQ